MPLSQEPPAKVGTVVDPVALYVGEITIPETGRERVGIVGTLALRGRRARFQMWGMVTPPGGA